jgi:LPS-assembly lipoprotein
MWWLRPITDVRRQTTDKVKLSVLCRPAFVVLVSALLAGCLQPLYGQLSPSGGPSVHDALSSVAVKQIAAPPGTAEARIAVDLRNDLLFDFTGGGGEAAPSHQLTIRLTANRASVIVNLHSARPDVENFGLDATYSLTEVATGKVVVTGSTFARVSYDIPGEEQRFARIRGLRDAETRAAKVIADHIQSRLASYFVAGT